MYQQYFSRYFLYVYYKFYKIWKSKEQSDLWIQMAKQSQNKESSFKSNEMNRSSEKEAPIHE